MSKRSSSSVDLDSSSLDDVRTECAAIALSVGLNWAPVKRRRSAGRTSWQQLCERAFQEHNLHHHELPHDVRLQQPGCWQPQDATARPLTHEEIAHVSTPAAPAAPAAALVEDEPSGSGAKRRKIDVDPIVRDWFPDVMDQWRTEQRWGIQQRLCEVWRLCLRRDQPEHSLPLETERTTSSTARQENCCLTRRDDTAQRARHAGDRRPVSQRGDDQRLGARLARGRVDVPASGGSDSSCSGCA